MVLSCSDLALRVASCSRIVRQVKCAVSRIQRQTLYLALDLAYVFAYLFGRKEKRKGHDHDHSDRSPV